MSERAALTPKIFSSAFIESIEETAFGLSQTPHDRHEEWLQGFAERVRAQWREVFPFLSGEDMDSMVDDVVTRVRAKLKAKLLIACHATLSNWLFTCRTQLA